jgi:hypothetical protein
MGVKDDIIPIYTSYKPNIEQMNIQIKKFADSSTKDQVKHEIDDIIQIGMNQYYQKAFQFSQDVFCSKFTDLWALYVTSIIPTLQACFVPIQPSTQIRNSCILAFRNQIVYPLISKFQDWKESRLKLLQMFVTLNQVDDGNVDIKKEVLRIISLLKQ